MLIKTLRFYVMFRLENRTLSTLRLDELACLPQVEPAALVIDSVAGANVSLRCSVFGLPSASVSWWHSNRLVANGSELQHAWEDQYYSIAEYRTNEHQVKTHFYMFTTMIFREEISISRAFWSGKNHFCLVQPVQKSFPISPEILFQECLFTFCM